MKLIDADALIEKCGEWYVEEGPEDGFIGTIKQLIDAQPTIKPERKTGRWIHLSRHKWIRTHKCDQCGNILDFDGVNAGRGDANFCPNCGADMKGEQDG